jgi:hypothetical protein
VNIDHLKEFIRSGGYAWPGGYPCALLMADGEVIDAQAAHENYRQIRRATQAGVKGGGSWGWIAVDVFVHWEGEPLICAHSGRLIDSAYGETEVMAEAQP